MQQAQRDPQVAPPTSEPASHESVGGDWMSDARDALRGIGLLGLVSSGDPPPPPEAEQPWWAAETPAERAKQARADEALAPKMAPRMEQLRKELNSSWVEDDLVLDQLRAMSPAERGYVARNLVDEEGDDLLASLDAGLGGDELDEAKALLAEGPGAPPKAPAEPTSDKPDPEVVQEKKSALLDELNSSWVEDEVVLGTLRDCTDAELHGILQSFSDEEGDGLEASLRAGLSGAELDEAMARLDRARNLDPATGAVVDRPNEARVVEELDALEGQLVDDLWTRDSAVVESLDRLSPSERLEVRRRFDEAHGEGSFEAKLDSQLSGDDRAHAFGLLANAEDPEGEKAEQRRHDAVAPKVDQAMLDRLAKANPTASPEALRHELDRLKADPKSPYQAELTKALQDKQSEIQTKAAAVFKAIDGGGDDEKALFSTLATLGPADAQLLRDEYRRHYGRDLDKALQGDLSEDEGKIASGLLASGAERTEGMKDFLREYSSSIGAEDEQLIFATLEGLSAEERAELASDPAFRAELTEDLGANEAAMVDAILSGEGGKLDRGRVAAAKVKMGVHGSGDWWDLSSWGTDEDAVLDELQGLSGSELIDAKSYYAQQFSGGNQAGMLEDLQSDLDGTTQKVIEAELAGDRDLADTHRLQLASEGLLWGMGTDEDRMDATLAHAAKQGRLDQVRARFEKEYGADYGAESGESVDNYALGADGRPVCTGEKGALDRMLDSEFGALGRADFEDGSVDVERARFDQLARTGKVDDGLELLAAMEGAGTDSKKVNAVLERYYDKSPSERQALFAQFDRYEQGLTGGREGLASYVNNDLSGSEAFEANELVMGKPTTPQEYLAAANRRHAFEREGLGNAFGNLLMDSTEGLGLHSKGEHLLGSTGEIRAMFDGTGKFTGDADRLEELAAWQSSDGKTYRETRDAAADALGDTVAVTGAIALAICTFGEATPLTVAILSEVLVAGAGVGLKAALKGIGTGYGAEEGLQDGVGLLATGATAGLSNGKVLEGVGQGIQGAVKNELWGKVLATGVTNTLENAPEAAVKHAVSQSYREMSDDEIAGSFVKAGAQHLVSGIATGATGGLLDDKLKIGQLDDVGLELGAGTLKGVGTGLAGQVADLDNAEMLAKGDNDALAAKVARGIGTEALQEGLSGAGRARAKEGLRNKIRNDPDFDPAQLDVEGLSEHDAAYLLGGDNLDGMDPAKRKELVDRLSPDQRDEVFDSVPGANDETQELPVIRTDKTESTDRDDGVRTTGRVDPRALPDRSRKDAPELEGVDPLVPEFRPVGDGQIEQGRHAWRDPVDPKGDVIIVDYDNDPVLQEKVGAIVEHAMAHGASDREERVRAVAEMMDSDAMKERFPLVDGARGSEAWDKQYADNQRALDLGEATEAPHACREVALYTHAALARLGERSEVVFGYVTRVGDDGTKRDVPHAWAELPDGTIVDASRGAYVRPGENTGANYRRNDNTKEPMELFRPSADHHLPERLEDDALPLDDSGAFDPVDGKTSSTDPDDPPLDELVSHYGEDKEPPVFWDPNGAPGFYDEHGEMHMVLSPTKRDRWADTRSAQATRRMMELVALLVINGDLVDADVEFAGTGFGEIAKKSEEEKRRQFFLDAVVDKGDDR